MLNRRIIIIILLFSSFLFLQAYAWPWDSPEVKARKLVDKLEKFASELGGVNIEWNLTYMRLANEITESGPVIVPILIEEVLDTTNAWNFRYLCEDLLIRVKNIGSSDGTEIAKSLLMVAKESLTHEDLRMNSIDCLSILVGTWSLIEKSERLQVLNELISMLEDEEIDWRIKWEIIQDLSRFAHRFSEELIPPLSKSLNNENEEIRAITVNTLGVVASRVKSEEIERILIDHLKTEENGLVKSQIAIR